MMLYILHNISSEGVGAVEGGEPEPGSPVEEGGESDSTNSAAALRDSGGAHGGRQ